MTAEAHHDEVKHDYHLVDPSPWPVVGAFAAFMLTFGTVLFMHPDMLGQGAAPTLTALGPWVFIPGVVLILATMWFWWRDVIREATFAGPSYAGGADRPALRHDAVHRFGGDVFRRLLLGLFRRQPVPEGGRRRRLAAAGRRGPVDPFELPFMNTLILLLSGMHRDLGASCAA